MSNYLAGPYKTNDGNAPNVQAVHSGYVYAGPLAGNPAVPTFRAITTADLPSGSITYSASTLTQYGAAYADTTSTLTTTTPGTQYQSLVANASGTGPSFQAINLAQSAAITGSLPIASGGTGATTSTGTGSNVLSASPTLTGTISAGNLTLTTPLAATSGGTGTTVNTGTGNNVLSASPTLTGTIVANAISLAIALPIPSGGTGLSSTSQNFVFIGPTSASGAPTWRLLTNADLPAIALTSGVSGILPVLNGGTGVTTSTGTGSNVLSASPTLTGTVAAGALTLTTPLVTTSGGTGVTTSTGTVNNVLSETPSLTGQVNITSTTNVPSILINTNATNDTIQVNSTNAAKQASIAFKNDALHSMFILQGGSTNTAPYTDQSTIIPSANGLLVNGTLKISNALGIAYGGTGLSSTTQNFVFAGPTSGAGAPTWRLLTSGDLPTTSVASPTGVLPVVNGGTGVTTSTGTGSTVLSVSPTFTGAVAINSGTSTPLNITTSIASDAIQVSNTNAGGFASTHYQNDSTTNGLYIGVGGSTVGGGNSNQAYIQAQGSNGIQINSPLKLTTTLAVIYGGTGVTTSTGSGNNVLSTQPTFSTTANTYTASFTSTGTGDTVLINNTVAGGTSTTFYNNDLGHALVVGQGGSTRGTVYSDQSFILPSANGLYIAGALKPTVPVGVIYGGTGTTTSTGTGSTVLNSGPSFIGTVNISGANVPLIINTSNGGDSIQVTSSAPNNQASLKLTNNAGDSMFLYIAGGTQAGNQHQPGLAFSDPTIGFKIATQLSIGNLATSAPTTPLTVNYNTAFGGIYVNSTNANNFNSIVFNNDSNYTAEFGVGGSTCSATQDRNRAYISGSYLQVNCGASIAGDLTTTNGLIQQQGVYSTVTSFQSTGSAYYGGSGGYVGYYLGSTGYYYFGPSGTFTNYLSGAITSNTGSSGVAPWFQVPYTGIYTIEWNVTTDAIYSPCFISKNGGGSNEYTSGGPNWSAGVVAFQDNWGFTTAPGNTPGQTLRGTVNLTTTDKLYFGLYINNSSQHVGQPNSAPNLWNLKFHMVQRTA